MTRTTGQPRGAPLDLTAQIRRLLTAQGAHSRWDRYALCCALDLCPSELEEAIATITDWTWSDGTSGAVMIRRSPVQPSPRTTTTGATP